MKYPLVLCVNVDGSEPPAVVSLEYDERYTRVERGNAGDVTIAISISGLWDDADVEVLISASGVEIRRDEFGRVPLYHGRDKNKPQLMWLSTHLSALTERCARGVSKEAFHAYTAFSFVPAPLSLFDGIDAVGAAEWVRDAVGAVEGSTGDAGAPPLEEELRRRLEVAVERQCQDLRGEQVAVFLSGGLDSAVTAAALVRAGLKVTAYSLDFGQYGISELPFAQAVAESLGIKLKAVRAFPKDIRRAFNATVKALDTVFGDGVTVPLWLLKEAAAKDGHTVAFNGEGGDQLFGGWTNKPIIASSVYGETGTRTGKSGPTMDAYMRTFHKLHGYEQLCFGPGILNATARHDLTQYIVPALSPEKEMEMIHLLRRANLMLKGAQNIQPRATYLAFAHGLHLRSLFCDKALADWTFSVPPELMLRGACEKYILKLAVEGWLPQEIIFREKRGMGVPLTEWCIGPLWNYLGRSFSAKRMQLLGYWQPDLPARITLGEVSAHLHGRRIGEILWLMLMWEKWLEVFAPEDAGNCAASYNPLWPPLILLRAMRRETMRA